MTDAIKETVQEATGLVKDFAGDVNKEVKKKPVKKLILFFSLIILAGVGTGYLFSLRQSRVDVPVSRDVSEGEVTKGMTVGVADEKTFRDSAEGKLIEGGVEGEGSHHLERPGGDSQSVYLTSSIVDLDKFVGRQIKVWGETFSAQKAGWLMDVGKVKVLD